MQNAKETFSVIDDNKKHPQRTRDITHAWISWLTLLSNPNQILSELSKKDYNLVILDMNLKRDQYRNEGILLARKDQRSQTWNIRCYDNGLRRY